jgi:hypothetical protein
MKYALIALAILAAVPTSIAEAATPKPSPRLFVQGGQVVQFAPGNYDFGGLSETAKSKVVLSVAETNAMGAGFTLLRLTVLNKGTALVGLSPEIIQVTGPKGEAATVLSYGEMTKLVDKSFAGQKFRAGFGNFVMAMGAASAGYNTNYGSYSSTTHTPRGGTYTTSGTVSTTTYNPYQAAAAQERAGDYIAANNAALQQRMAVKMDGSKAYAFAPDTLLPGKIGSTPVPILLPKGAKSATVVVTLQGEAHTFAIALADDPKPAKNAPVIEVAEWPEGPVWTPPELENAAVNAWASDHIDQKGWTLAGFDSEAVYFADLATFERLPDGVMRMWVKTELYRPTGAIGLPIRSDRRLWELNCAAGKVRTPTFEAYPLNNLQGAAIREEDAAAPWFAPPPGTVTESYSAKLCAQSAPQGTG